MTRLMMVAAFSTCSVGAAVAGGIDRAGQPVGIIFKDGNYAEIGATHTSPDVGGQDYQLPIPFGPAEYDNVANDFTSYSFGVKYDVNERFTVALTGSNDFGADIEYPDEPYSALGGTVADADTYAYTLMARYKFNDNWSIHSGLRSDVASGKIELGGLAYGPVDGYKVELDQTVGYGYLVGAAYEIPEIALRVAVTYNSEIKHEFDTSETLSGNSLGKSNKTEVKTPQSVNIDFQTGIAENTLLFGSVRWADWSEFRIDPEIFTTMTGSGLVELEDSTTYTIGLGHRFSENLSGSASFIYEPEQSDDLVSPLAPTNGFRAVAIGASYRMDQIEVAGGIRYAWLGEARPETGTPDVARADFKDNSAVSVGLRIGYYF